MDGLRPAVLKRRKQIAGIIRILLNIYVYVIAGEDCFWLAVAQAIELVEHMIAWSISEQETRQHIQITNIYVGVEESRPDRK